MSPCFLVTGGAGFIGSHLVDELIKQGNDVVVVDNLISGYRDNVNPAAVFYNNDISDFQKLGKIFENHYFDGIFHLAAISRTVWCIDDPIMAYKCNVTGTLNILEYSRIKKIKRVVLASSSIVYAFMTPYRTSKEALEGLADTYNKMYSVSTISLRFSNVYGPRQSETGPALNVFASFKKSIRENGFISITGDGSQSRSFTYVSDIVDGVILSMKSDYCGILDLCTDKLTTLNEASTYFKCAVKYIEERPGDVKTIEQSPENAFRILGWKSKIDIKKGIEQII